MNFLGRFSKNARTSNLVKISTTGAELLHADRQMDVHDKANIAFHSFENAPRNTHELLLASKENDLGGNVEKTKYMFMSHKQNAGTDHNTQQNKSYGRVAKFTHFGITLKKNQSCICKEIKRSLNS